MRFHFLRHLWFSVHVIYIAIFAHCHSSRKETKAMMNALTFLNSADKHFIPKDHALAAFGGAKAIQMWTTINWWLKTDHASHLSSAVFCCEEKHEIFICQRAKKSTCQKLKKNWRCHLIIALCSHFTLHTHTQNIFINEKVMHRMNEEEYIKAKMADKYLNKYVFFVWCNYWIHSRSFISS